VAQKQTLTAKKAPAQPASTNAARRIPENI